MEGITVSPPPCYLALMTSARRATISVVNGDGNNNNNHTAIILVAPLQTSWHPSPPSLAPTPTKRSSLPSTSLPHARVSTEDNDDSRCCPHTLHFPYSNLHTCELLLGSLQKLSSISQIRECPNTSSLNCCMTGWRNRLQV